MSTADWPAIRSEYEQGASLRSLAAKHSVSKTYIIEKRNKEQWNRPTDRPLTNRPTAPTSLPFHLPIPDDAIGIARIGLKQLAMHLQADEILPIKDHKSLSDALAQYVKVLITAPQEHETHNELSIPLNTISPRTRLAIQQLLAEDEQEKVS